ncbi:MAG: hypothetical protein FJ118_06240 [Deltaproteobacteria bacterium]|nr:hypothetical protein [Deltaproteobacteria bacterium]
MQSRRLPFPRRRNRRPPLALRFSSQHRSSRPPRTPRALPRAPPARWDRDAHPARPVLLRTPPDRSQRIAGSGPRPYLPRRRPRRHSPSLGRLLFNQLQRTSQPE